MNKDIHGFSSYEENSQQEKHPHLSDDFHFRQANCSINDDSNIKKKKLISLCSGSKIAWLKHSSTLRLFVVVCVLITFRAVAIPHQNDLSTNQIDIHEEDAKQHNTLLQNNKMKKNKQKSR